MEVPCVLSAINVPGEYRLTLTFTVCLLFFAVIFVGFCIFVIYVGLGMWRIWVRRGGCIVSWWGNRREGDHWGDLGVDGWIILGWISRRCDVGIWTGLGWLRIETDGGGL